MSSNEDHRLNGPLADLRARGDGFRTPPPAYFDELADRVLQNAVPSPAPARRRYLPWMAIAASLILLLVAGFLLRPASTSGDAGLATGDQVNVRSADDILAGIDPADIEAYIATDLNHFDSERYADNDDNDYPYE